MSVAALLTYLVTATAGLFLLTIWLIEYDHEFQTAAATRLPVPVISAHALLAVTGLVVWGVYLLTDRSRLAWATVVTLVLVAVLGCGGLAETAGSQVVAGRRAGKMDWPATTD